MRVTYKYMSIATAVFSAAMLVLICLTDSSAAITKMYWTASEVVYPYQGNIQRANLDGSEVEDVITGVPFPETIAVDNSAGKIYWTDSEGIKQANLDGSDVQTVIPNFSPQGIAVDPAGGKIYWAAGSADLDGTNRVELFTVQGNAFGIALDISGGKMYWTVEDYVNKVSIQRANLEGTGEVENLVGGYNFFEGIALDVSGGKMYWTDESNGKVWRANLNGGDIEDLVTLGSPEGIALDVTAGKMYWTDDEGGKIMQSNLDGSDVEELVTELDNPGGIALVSIGPSAPEEIIEEIADDVGDLVSTEALNEGEGQALTSKLDTALKKLDEGNSKAACNVLKAFTNQINAMIKSGRLSEKEGQALIEDANSICM